MDDADLTHELEARCWGCGALAAPDSSYRAAGLYLCPACGLRFAPGHDAEELRERYTERYFAEYPGGEAYGADEPQRRYEARRRLAWLRGHVEPPATLLEIGSAGGYFLDEARRGGFDVRGIEPAGPTARAAADRFDVPVFAGMIEDATLERGSLDVVCAWHVIEHIADPAPALRRVRDALVPGGLLLLEVPNIESVRARRQKEQWFNLDPAHHVGHWSPRSLPRLLDRAGFATVAVDTLPTLAYFRPGKAVQPRALAGQVLDVALTRTAPRRAHPTRHELLRAIARVI